jgi:hypothetical protein
MFMFDLNTAKVKFPLMAYLHQPIGHPVIKLILNLIKFKKLYHVWLLKICLSRKINSKISQGNQD